MYQSSSCDPLNLQKLNIERICSFLTVSEELNCSTSGAKQWDGYQETREWSRQILGYLKWFSTPSIYSVKCRASWVKAEQSHMWTQGSISDQYKHERLWLRANKGAGDHLNSPRRSRRSRAARNKQESYTFTTRLHLWNTPVKRVVKIDFIFYIFHIHFKFSCAFLIVFFSPN